jgi:GntR family transcriptional regulator/MocR family aminotransferase
MYGIIIKPDQAVSQFRQLYEQLRDKIINGQIPVSAKLVSSREMAAELQLSRAVVLEVIDQLKVEGYLETRHGSGTYITPGLDYWSGKEEKRQAGPKSSKA